MHNTHINKKKVKTSLWMRRDSSKSKTGRAQGRTFSMLSMTRRDPALTH